MPHDLVHQLAVHDEKVVKVVLTVHHEAKTPNTDADSMTRRKVLDQITDLDSQVSAVVLAPLLQLHLKQK